jgi:hypothetical protein
MSSSVASSIRRRAFARASAAPLLCVATILGTALGVGACVDPDEGGEPDPFEPEAATTTTGTSGELSYPLGPYGVARGQIIQNFSFSGFPAPDENNSDMVPLVLADFFNPTGDGVFPEGSPHGAGTPKPRAIGVVVGAVWCAPCQEEARRVLPEEHARLEPLGGELLFVLADTDKPGVPASKQDLVRWTDTFDSDYPSVLDPAYALGAVIKSDSFPANILVDTRDMSIVDIVSGVPPESYWDEFASLARGE